MEELQKYYIVILKMEGFTIRERYDYVVIKSKMGHAELNSQGFNIYGCFGRKDYAHHWCDYKNGKITTQQHQEFLFN